MELIVFEGNRGMGKTLGMVLHAKRIQAYTGCNLFANFPVRGAEGFYSFEDFKKVSICKNSIVLLDECHNDLDSRDYSTSSVKYFSHMIFYLRKLGCVMFLTTPLFSAITSRVRDVTNIVCRCSKTYDYFVYDFWDNDQGVFLKRRKVLKDKAFMLCKNVYNTKSLVNPLEYPSSKQEFLQILSEIKRENEHAQAQA